MNLTQVFKKIFLRIKRIPRYILVKRYGLKPFHLSISDDKPYVKPIIDHLNSREKRRSVLEIGVGLGDILFELDFDQLTGLDHKQDVLDALKSRSYAKGLKHKLHISKFKFTLDRVKGRYDAIILINWPQQFDSILFRQEVQKIYFENLNKGGELIFDCINTVVLPQYPHAHSPVFMNEHINAKKLSLGKFPVAPGQGMRVNREVVSFQKV